jgi:hypothetical protein
MIEKTNRFSDYLFFLAGLVDSSVSTLFNFSTLFVQHQYSTKTASYQVSQIATHGLSTFIWIHRARVRTSIGPSISIPQSDGQDSMAHMQRTRSFKKLSRILNISSFCS